MIAEGDKLPDANLTQPSPEGELPEVGVADYFGEGRFVLIGLPGPFTPTCSKNLPRLSG